VVVPVPRLIKLPLFIDPVIGAAVVLGKVPFAIDNECSQILDARTEAPASRPKRTSIPV
jgi:hypothetical protein